MKNLKRALSVVLSAAMMISLLAVGASAASINDFSDKDEITHTEAVSTLVELGVIAGKDGGVYDPAGIVTRAEMAKMICVVLNGGKDPQLSSTSTVSYKDTVGHWAAAYIEYCTNLGIVAGDGTGNFNPNATVTGTQAAKMLLVAMGYKSDIEGFTGATWATAVDVRANQKGLYDEMNITTSAGLSRDDAAQMVYNALNALTVTYDYTLITSNGNLASLPTLKDGTKTLLEDKFNAVKVEGIVVGNEYADLTSDATASNALFGSAEDAGKTKVQITNYDDGQNTFDGTKTFTVSTGADVIGRAVTFYVKPSTTSASSASKATVLGTLMVSSDNTVVTDYSDDAPNDVLDDNNLDWDAAAQVYTNYASKTAVDSTFKTADGTQGQERVFIDNNDDGNVDVVLVNNYALAKVTKYSTKDDGAITVDQSGFGAALALTDKSDVVGFSNVAKDDYVIAMVAGGKLYVNVADTTTGNLDAYKGTSPATSLTVDGTKYNVSAQDCTTALTAAATYGSSNLDTDATYYLDAQGYIVGVGDVDATAANYAYVKGAAAANGIDSARVKLVLPDGTTKTYDVNDDSTLKVNSTDDVTANGVATVSSPDNTYKLVTYTVNSAGEVKMSAPATTETGTAASFTKNKTSVTATAVTGTFPDYATSTTVFYYVNASGDVSVYTGYASAPSTTANNVTVALNSSSKVAAVLFGTTSATASSDDTLFLYSWGSVSTDYTLANVYLPGSDEATTIKVDAGSYDAATAANTDDMLYTFTQNSDGYYELSSATVYTGTVQNDPSSTVVIDGGDAGEYKVTDSTVAIDNTDPTSDPTATVSDPGCSTGDTVSMIVNSDGEILMLVVTANA